MRGDTKPKSAAAKAKTIKKAISNFVKVFNIYFIKSFMLIDVVGNGL